jgi:RecG-like helicase
MYETKTFNLSEALTIFADHTHDIKKACEDNIEYTTAQHSFSTVTEFKGTQEDIHNEVNRLIVQDKIKPMYNILKTITAIRNRRFIPQRLQITDDMIAQAREYPVKELLEQHGYRFAKDHTHCLWHKENTASLHYIKHRNTVYCFGCNKHADAIDVYRTLVPSTSFKQAVRELSKVIHTQ